MPLNWLSDGHRGRLLFLGCALAVLAGVVGFFTFDRTVSITLFRCTSYWVDCALAAVLIWVGGKVFLESRRCTWLLCRNAWPQLLLTAIVVGFVAFPHQRSGLRIVNDDNLLTATARTLFEEQQAAYLDNGYRIGTDFDGLTYGVDKRPTFYPWLLSMVHAATGYRFSNAFWLNRASVLLLTWFLFLIGRRVHERWGGVAFPLLVFCAPLVAHYGSGPGFEIPNLLALAMLGHAFCLVLEEPSSDRVAWMGLVAVMAANMRYESVIFFTPTLVILLIAWRKAGRAVLPWSLFLVPLLMIPWAWRQHMFDSPSVWQLQSKPEAQGHVFGMQFFGENVGHALNFFLSTEPRDGNSIALFLVGSVAAVMVLVGVRRRLKAWWSRPTGETGLFVFWLGLGLHLVLMMLYFWGQFDDLTTQRLALPVIVALALPVLAIASLRPWIPPVVIALCILHYLGSTIPQLHSGRMQTANRAAFTHEQIRRYIEEHPNDHRLVIDNNSVRVWLQYETPVLSPAWVRREKTKLLFHWKHGSFSEILAVQRTEYDPAIGDWTVVPDDDLGPDFGLQTTFDLKLGPTGGMRLAKVVAISDDHLEWAPRREAKGELEKLRLRKEKFEIEWLHQLPRIPQLEPAASQPLGPTSSEAKP